MPNPKIKVVREAKDALELKPVRDRHEVRRIPCGGGYRVIRKSLSK
jgi:hypothetical protein